MRADPPCEGGPDDVEELARRLEWHDQDARFLRLLPALLPDLRGALEDNSPRLNFAAERAWIAIWERVARISRRDVRGE